MYPTAKCWRRPIVARTINLPNVREFFIPSQGYTIAEADLSGADAQVVAWDAGDEELKALFRTGVKIHKHNAEAMFGSKEAAKKSVYQQNKVAVHLTNYGGSPNAMMAAPTIHWNRNKCMEFQRRWFELHPAIKEWHDRIHIQLQKTRTVSNKYGFRRVYFDRPERLLPEALAWIAQSTVAVCCNTGALALHERAPWVQLLLQVHDSIVFQYKTRDKDKLPEVKRLLHNVIAYDDPLTIPWTLKTSTRSWGHTKDAVW